MPIANIESLDREGRGVAHVDGKAVFVDGALPGEVVEYSAYRKKPAWELGQLLNIRKESPARITPRCSYFGACGGCSMQHIDERTQVAAKQRVLEDALWHIGHVRPEVMLRPVYGTGWGYRHRARLSARLVRKKGGVLVGFHERKSSYVADMTSCEVLPSRISALIPELRALIGSLLLRDRLPQVEVAVGEEVTVLVLRVLVMPEREDEERLKRFAETQGIQIWLQPKGPETARPFWPLAAPPLYYALPEFDVRIGFAPTDFTQVNHTVNQLLVNRALALLAPRPGERIADYFCGLGNFTLPIARSGANVVGIEGSAGLIARAVANAQLNDLTSSCRFEVANLFDANVCGSLPAFDKVLIDPPREGAVELVKSFAARPPGRIVYVSCDPATLARDAGVLVNILGYRLTAAGVANMFPHTSHVESITLFDRE